MLKLFESDFGYMVQKRWQKVFEKERLQEPLQGLGTGFLQKQMEPSSL